VRHVSLLVAVALGVTACLGATTEPDLMTTLCAAIDQAAAGDADAAADTFEVDAHVPLHDLADDLADVDRAATAQLLEAKYDLESSIRGGTMAPAPLVHQRLLVLTEHVQEALTALDRPAPRC
jgi:hypothetical protein